MHLPLSYITMDHVDAGQWKIKLQRYVIICITFVIVQNYFSTFHKIIVVPPSHRTSPRRRTTRRALIGWARLRVEADQSARATVRLCCVFTLLVGDRLKEVECSRGAHNTSKPEQLKKILTRLKEQPCERSWVSYNEKRREFSDRVAF